MRTSSVKVGALALDLKNFRTVQQQSEIGSIVNMAQISPDYFWELARSLISKGFVPTENIVVVELSDGTFLVKEGNRRVGVIKLCLGLIAIVDDLFAPADVQSSIKGLSEDWKSKNNAVPCVIYSESEVSEADRIVSITHGKAEKAGRDPWTPVARARHARETSKRSEPGLDVLERFIQGGTSKATVDQKHRWSGDFPLSVLDEAIKRLAPRCGFSSARQFADRVELDEFFEDLICDVGMKRVTFPKMRSDRDDFAKDYRFPGLRPLDSKTSEENSTRGGTSETGLRESAVESQHGEAVGPRSGASAGVEDSKSGGGSAKPPETGDAAESNGSTASKRAEETSSKTGLGVRAGPSDSAEGVRKMLRSFTPRGEGREKVALLKKEMLYLSIENCPTAFVFLLRSILEISAKAYCADHQIALLQPDGKEHTLKHLLEKVGKDLCPDKQKDKEMAKLLHGAFQELNREFGFLTITSMNQLVHNPKFSVAPKDICTSFSNIFPLLEKMNEGVHSHASPK